MAIPDYKSIMLPLLKLSGDGQEHGVRESVEQLAPVFNLTDEEKNRLLPSGSTRYFQNRVAWALTYLKKAGVLEATRRGYFKITERGKSLLLESPNEINNKRLERYPEFIEFKTGGKQSNSENGEICVKKDIESEQTPEESLEYAYQAIRQTLTEELLAQVKACHPSFFEKLVVELLVKMGYGGSRKDAGQAVGKSGDEGIDGIIKEDRLGLDVIYIQAKKWDNPVSRPEVQKFAGALQGFRAKKGIFITTSNFSSQAKDFVNKVDNKIVLIDGQQLAQFMMDFNIGVSTSEVYEIKKIDNDYFEN